MGIRAVANYTGKRSCHRMPGGGFDSAAELITSFAGPKVWYDFSNIATLQQDSAGTIPVTTAGDPIGRVMDISGANNHAVQVTAASRPLWQTTFAAFDGIDDSWTTPSIDFTSTDKITVIIGIRKTSDATISTVLELSPIKNSNNGVFALFGTLSAGFPNTAFFSKGTVEQSITTALVSPISRVLTGIGNISAPNVTLRSNGISVGTTTATQGTGTFGNFPLFIGRRNDTSLPFTGNIYGLIIIGRLLSTAEIRMLEQYMAAKVGIII